MNQETWLDVTNYEGKYSVSSTGKVRSEYRKTLRTDGKYYTVYERVLSSCSNNSGYSTVSLHDGRGSVGVGKFVHKLVAEAFMGLAPSSDHHVRHKNGTRSDNRAENLEYGTRSENMMDAVRHGTHNHASKTHCKRGHMFDEINTHIRHKKNGSIQRVCRMCDNLRGQAENKRKREAS